MMMVVVMNDDDDNYNGNHNKSLFSFTPRLYQPINSTLTPSATSFKTATNAKSIAYSIPFVVLQTDSLVVYDQHTADFVQMLSSPSIEYLIDSALPYQLMMEEEYTVMVGITPTGELHILDYLNADSFTKEAMTNNRIPTAFETLHRSQKVHCSLMDPKTAHLQAFLYYLRRLDLPTAFMHAKEGALDPVELLQLWPDLQNEQTSEMAKMQWEQGLQIMTADVIGRNVKNILEFVVTTLKQNSNNPASITSECEEVKRKVDEAYTQLLSFLQQSRHHTACPRVIDVAILKLMLLNAAKQTEEKEEKEEKETHMKEKETEEETEILQRGEEKIITFVSQTSACEESDVEEELRSRAMLIALSQFYLTKNQPAKALTIWRDLQEKGVDRSVFYLLHAESKSNRDDDKDDEEVLKLMLEFTPWMLAIAPEKVFTIFTQAAVSTASIYQSVLALFPAESDYHIRYVDHCVNTLRIPDEKLATEFACHLLQQELSIVEANTVDLTMCLSMKDTPSCLRKHRSVVLTYLKENQNYSNEEVWNAIEATALWFEKVILLNRMKRFDEAISILLNELRSIRYACEFCQEGGQPAWEILLKKLFYEEAEE